MQEKPKAVIGPPGTKMPDLPVTSEFPDDIGALLELKKSGQILEVEMVTYEDKSLDADLVVTKPDGSLVIVRAPETEED